MDSRIAMGLSLHELFLHSESSLGMEFLLYIRWLKIKMRNTFWNGRFYRCLTRRTIWTSSNWPENGSNTLLLLNLSSSTLSIIKSKENTSWTISEVHRKGIQPLINSDHIPMDFSETPLMSLLHFHFHHSHCPLPNHPDHQPKKTLWINLVGKMIERRKDFWGQNLSCWKIM